ncbi:MAG: hypothetical protein AAGF59_08290 [Pseudomonadota bacterium]
MTIRPSALDRRAVLLALFLSSSFLSTGPALAGLVLDNPHGVERNGGSSLKALDPQSVDQVMDYVRARIAENAIAHNGRYYAWFRIGGVAASSQSDTGFTSVLRPNATALISEGLLEVIPRERWSVSILGDDQRGFRGEIGFRLSGYRIHDPYRGLAHDQMLPLNWWKWQVAITGRELTLTPINLSPKFAADIMPQRLLAEIFNIEAGRVQVSKPSRNDVETLVRSAG